MGCSRKVSANARGSDALGDGTDRCEREIAQARGDGFGFDEAFIVSDFFQELMTIECKTIDAVNDRQSIVGVIGLIYRDKAGFVHLKGTVLEFIVGILG